MSGFPATLPARCHCQVASEATTPTSRSSTRAARQRRRRGAATGGGSCCRMPAHISGGGSWP
ncbi:hypothetical protein [Hymenobacter convexus]|uniref:hypothetical protein n=1 Tax=Hymenobacter sp. CA1UV-4 TaxID=3063782 RepID=UPI00271415C1|nr:hypothetical protein [Hymenobacter sp. CA1UV-4]MDO7853774.1 hypothetical protein [Hymenobacter sp. CA1UV-4]